MMRVVFLFSCLACAGKASRVGAYGHDEAQQETTANPLNSLTMLLTSGVAPPPNAAFSVVPPSVPMRAITGASRATLADHPITATRHTRSLMAEKTKRRNRDKTPDLIWNAYLADELGELDADEELEIDQITQTIDNVWRDDDASLLARRNRFFENNHDKKIRKKKESAMRRGRISREIRRNQGAIPEMRVPVTQWTEQDVAEIRRRKKLADQRIKKEQDDAHRKMIIDSIYQHRIRGKKAPPPPKILYKNPDVEKDPAIPGMTPTELRKTKQKTWFPRAADMDNDVKDWWLIDAKGLRLGRMASEIAKLLLGKHKPTYTPGQLMGDYVIVVNAEKVMVTGKKFENKWYRRHSGRPGGMKVESFKELQARIPERIVEKAVWGMLPKNSYGRELFRHLKVYKGPNHPHEAQQPEQLIFGGLTSAPDSRVLRFDVPEGEEGLYDFEWKDGKLISGGPLVIEPDDSDE